MTHEDTQVYSPIPTRASKSAVHDYAESTAKKLAFSPKGSMKSLVKKLGGQIKVSDPFAEDIDETILVRAPRDFTIYVSSFTSERRDRFTIAHELGHYLLHYPKVLREQPKAIMEATRWVDEADKDQVRAEWEANWFAAAFLMPAISFENKFNQSGLEESADHFGVSLSAAKIRAKSLGLDLGN